MILEKVIETTESKLLKTTLLKMFELEELVKLNPVWISFVNRNFSMYRNNVDKLSLKIWQYMRTHFDYVDDYSFKKDSELLISPLVLLSYKQGDCDDFSLFARSILSTMYIQSYYILFGQRDNYTHIAVKVNNQIIDGANSYYNVVANKYSYYALVNFDNNEIILQHHAKS